jgi:hypothetical protein
MTISTNLLKLKLVPFQVVPLKYKSRFLGRYSHAEDGACELRSLGMTISTNLLKLKLVPCQVVPLKYKSRFLGRYSRAEDSACELRSLGMTISKIVSSKSPHFAMS